MQNKNGYMQNLVRLWLLDILIDAGANLNSKNNYGETPLHAASRSNCPEIVKILIKAGADLNSQNQVRKTPLHLAAFMNRIENAELLIAAGADLYIDDDHSERAEQRAETPEMRDIFAKARNRNNQSQAGCTIS